MRHPVGIDVAKDRLDLEASGGYEAPVACALLAELAAVLAGCEDLARHLCPPADEERLDLEALVARRRQLITMLGAERSRLAKTRPAVRPSLEALLAQLEDVDGQMRDQVERHVGALDSLPPSVDGIGPVVAATLTAGLPELGHLGRRLAGGRPQVRRSLYMATLSAVGFCPLIGESYERLLAAGKLKKIARVACLRKLRTILNAIARESRPFERPSLA